MQTKKTILLTGSSRGIGLLTAKTLAKAGHKVYASMRDISTRNSAIAKKLSEFATANKLDLIPTELDVTSKEQCDSVISEIQKQNTIDVLINNAGVMPVGLTEAFTNEQVQACMDVNLFGPINTTKAVLPAMRANKNGKLIHLSSSAGRLSIPYFGVYCSSKWALEAYMESLQIELDSFNIETCIIEPSGHGTELVNSSPEPSDKNCLESYGELAQGRDKLLGMFKGFFAQQDPISDAQNIADAILTLVEQSEPMPIRYQIGQDMGVEGINKATAPIQNGLTEQLKPVYSN